MKKKNHKSKSNGRKTYTADVLAVALLLSLFLEGMMFGVVSSNGKMPGIELLDMSASINQTKNDLVYYFEPVIDTVAGINQFYASSADETIDLLSPNFVNYEVQAVSDLSLFFTTFSTEMASVLDISDAFGQTAYAY